MKIVTFTHHQKTYPLIFSLNGAEKIEDECVPIEILTECLLNPKKYGKNGISMIKSILIILINEGIEYCKYKRINKVKGKVLCLNKVDDNLFVDFHYNQIDSITKSIFYALIESKKKESTTK